MTRTTLMSQEIPESNAGGLARRRFGRRDLFPEGVAWGDPDGHSVLLLDTAPPDAVEVALYLPVLMCRKRSRNPGSCCSGTKTGSTAMASISGERDRYSSSRDVTASAFFPRPT